MAPSDIYDRVLAEVERPLIQMTLAATMYADEQQRYFVRSAAHGVCQG